MIIPFTPVFRSTSYDRDKLCKVENDLTAEDFEYYDRVGWKDFRPEHFIDTLLPELGEPLYYRNANEPVIEIKGRRYRVAIEDHNPDEPYSADGKSLVLAETDDLLTPPDGKPHWYWHRFFGQPQWIQGEFFPADLRGEPCYHLLTVRNHWGDMGNWNILVGLDEAGVPDVVYFEASCH